MTESDLFFQAITFLNTLFEQLRINQVRLQPQWPIDHLCYRATSLESYQALKNDFSKFGDLLIESQVNGRPIATYKLREPIFYKGYAIDVVELPAPKSGKTTIEGFEHAEVVCNIPFEQIINEHPQCQFDESGLKKEINKELEMILNACALKFHHQSLESVIHLEK